MSTISNAFAIPIELGTTRTSSPGPGTMRAVTLSAEELDNCRRFGIDAAKYAQHRASSKAHQATGEAATLTAEELENCKVLGIDPAQFAAHRAKSIAARRAAP